MPCNLVILGKDFDIDAFLAKTKLKGFFKKHRGELLFEKLPKGRKTQHSRIAIETSTADFDNLDKQIKDTIRYLKRNKEKLKYIKKVKDLELAVLDFGIKLKIDGKNVVMQSERYPAELLKLAGDIGLDIETSIYPIK